MQIFPEFTWDYIIQNCEQKCSRLETFIEQNQAHSYMTQQGYLRSAKGLIAIVPKLRGHPNLGSLVPMMSLISLRWFPADGLEICLFCDSYTSKYSITVTRRDLTVVEEKIVAFDEVADEIYAAISKYRAD